MVEENDERMATLAASLRLRFILYFKEINNVKTIFNIQLLGNFYYRKNPMSRESDIVDRYITYDRYIGHAELIFGVWSIFDLSDTSKNTFIKSTDISDVKFFLLKRYGFDLVTFTETEKKYVFKEEDRGLTNISPIQHGESFGNVVFNSTIEIMPNNMGVRLIVNSETKNEK